MFAQWLQDSKKCFVCRKNKGSPTQLLCGNCWTAKAKKHPKEYKIYSDIHDKHGWEGSEESREMYCRVVYKDVLQKQMEKMK